MLYIPLCSCNIQKQIVYYAVEHNYLALTNSYMFSSFMTIIEQLIQNFKIHEKMQYIYIQHLHICTYMVKVFVFHF
jgi:hypothetical protein